MEEWKLRYAYYQAIGARSLIGAVARIRDPGCKNDCSPTLVGEQDLLKSTSIEAIFSEPWFTDEISDFGSKDAAMQTKGKWGIEISELVAARNDVDKTKAFQSRRTDRFRPPYGHTVIEQPRQCVFWGTTNRDTFLFDETGNRRSWSVRCSRINIKALKNDRSQLWAEADARYKAGEQFWLHEPNLIAVAAAVQAEFTEEEVHEERIRVYLDTVSSTTADEVLAHIGVLIVDRTKAQANSVTRVLRKAGWVRKQETAVAPADKHGKRYRPWRWYPPTPADGTTTK
jgi:predicted P-loop ATPase